MFTEEDRKDLAIVKAFITQHERGGSGGVQYFERVGQRTAEWMIVDPTLPPDEQRPEQDGYRVTTDVVLARVWGRQYSGQGTEPVQLTRDPYVAQQEWARERARIHRDAQIAVIRAAQ